jgi:phenylalanyl-tRNA synthetase beta chain
LLDHLPQEISYVTLPKFPSIQRDLAVVVNRETVAGNLSSTILEVGAPLLKSVHLFDVYEGERIEAGKKSLAFSLTYQDTEKTLTDEDVAQVHDKIVKELEQKWQADLRK